MDNKKLSMGKLAKLAILSMLLLKPLDLTMHTY